MSIEVNVQKEFGSFRLDVSFAADNGVLAILGGSGCGKSMTLRCIAGIVQPDAGRIMVDGIPFFDSEKKINLSPQERHVGLLFQNYALFSSMTVAENIAAGIRDACPKKEKLARAQALIRQFRLDGLEKRLPRELSGGQQQRVALARILIGKPRLLMLDEPFSALDSYLKWEMELELRQLLQEFSGTTLFVSHNRDEVYRLAQKVCVLDQGTSQPVQTVRDLFDHPGTQAAALLSGCKNYTRCRAADGARIFTEDWGVSLRCSRPVPEDIRLLGVRRHYVRPAHPREENAFPCTVLQIIDDVFSTIVLLRPCSAPPNARYPTLEMELDKAAWAALHCRPGEKIHVSVAPEDLLLLH